MGLFSFQKDSDNQERAANATEKMLIAQQRNFKWVILIGIVTAGFAATSAIVTILK